MVFTLRSTFAVVLALLCSRTSPGTPPPYVPLPKAIEQADFVGVIRIAVVPPAKKEGFRASAPPVVTAKSVAVLKGEAKADLTIVWQTYCGVCILQDPKTVEVVPPAVGDKYMVFLTRTMDGTYTRLGYQWHFHKMPAVRTVSVAPPREDWRCLVEVSPAVANVGESVRFRFTRTRLADKPWVGADSKMTTEGLEVIDFTRKQVLKAKKPEPRETVQAVVEKGQTVVDVIDITDAFGITKPGEYWLFGGTYDGNAPLRFEITDRFRFRTGVGNR